MKLAFLTSILFAGLIFTATPAAAVQDPTISCTEPALHVVKPKKHYSAPFPNRQLVTFRYGLLAAASFDTYSDDPRDFRFDITTLSLGWQPFNLTFANSKGNRTRFFWSGLSFDTYYNEQPSCVTVLLAIRGTDTVSVADWYSNASPVTRWLPIPTQYDQIRKLFPKIVSEAERRFPNRTIRYVATGHSLGGGLAEHVANCFDGVSAVVFNPSFVRQLGSECRHRSPLTLRIAENYDILKSFRAILPVGPQTATGHIHEYTVNTIELGTSDKVKQHNMLKLAAGMLRTSIDCVENPSRHCEITRTEWRETGEYSSRLYCDRLVTLYPYFAKKKYNPQMAKTEKDGKTVQYMICPAFREVAKN